MKKKVQTKWKILVIACLLVLAVCVYLPFPSFIIGYRFSKSDSYHYYSSTFLEVIPTFYLVVGILSVLVGIITILVNSPVASTICVVLIALVEVIVLLSSVSGSSSEGYIFKLSTGWYLISSLTVSALFCCIAGNKTASKRQ